MEVELRIIKGPTHIRSIRLQSAEAIVGRGKGCRIRIPSAEVSRRHCLLMLDNGCLCVEDLKSANGTFLNGVRIQSRRVVRPGDRLEVGPLTLEAQYETSPETLDRLALALGETEDDDVVEGVILEEDDDITATQGIEVLDDGAVPLPMGEFVEEEPLPEEEVAAFAVDLEEEDLPFAELAEDWKLSDPHGFRDILADLDEPQK